MSGHFRRSSGRRSILNKIMKDLCGAIETFVSICYNMAIEVVDIYTSNIPSSEYLSIIEKF